MDGWTLVTLFNTSFSAEHEGGETEHPLISRASIYLTGLLRLWVITVPPSGPLLRGKLPVRQMETLPGHNVLLISQRNLTGSLRYHLWFEVSVVSEDLLTH